MTEYEPAGKAAEENAGFVDMDTPQDGENIMTMTRKRPNLAEFEASAEHSQDEEQPQRTAPTKPVHKSVYIPPAVLDQLDLLSSRSDLVLGEKEIQHFCP